MFVVHNIYVSLLHDWTICVCRYTALQFPFQKHKARWWKYGASFRSSSWVKGMNWIHICFTSNEKFNNKCQLWKSNNSQSNIGDLLLPVRCGFQYWMDSDYGANFQNSLWVEGINWNHLLHIEWHISPLKLQFEV